MTFAVMIMAAGESRRFGGCKLLADINGQAMLQQRLEVARSLQPDQLLVITGAWHEELAAAQRQELLFNVPMLKNPHWQQGLGSSIAFGVSHLQPNIEYLLILLADQVAIHADALKALLNQCLHYDISCAHYAGRRGVPAVFHHSLFNQLGLLSGEKGAKSLLNSPDLRVAQLAMPEAEQDIDTPADMVLAR